MIKTGFFNSIENDRTYKAEMFSEYFSSFIANGIFPNPSTNLQVLESEGMNIIISPGKAWINGYYINNDSNFTLKLDAADGVLKRIDRVVCRLSMIDRDIQILVKKGVSSSNPSPTQLIRDSDYYELVIADILISNGATQITQSNITDTRLNSEYCGVVHGLVDQVDTTSIFNQYLAWFNETKTNANSELSSFQTQKQEEFQTWFDSVKGILEGDVAANLATQISALSDRVTALENDSATKQEVETLSETVIAYKSETGSKLDAAALKQEEILSGVKGVKADTANILAQFPISGGTNFFDGIVKSSNYIRSHDSSKVLEVTGKGILLGISSVGGGVRTLSIQVDGGDIYQSYVSPYANTSFFIPFESNLLIYSNNSANIDVNYILM